MKAGKVIGRIFLVLGSFIVVTALGAHLTLYTICNGPSESAKQMFVTTMLETGALKFLAKWYFSEEEIEQYTQSNGMIHNDAEVDTDLIVISDDPEASDTAEEFDENGIRIDEITGRTFFAKMMVIKDPSRVTSTTIYPWSDLNHSKDGKTLEELVTEGDYLAGINGGEYESSGNWGGRPKGVVVCQGEIQFNQPENGDVLVGFSKEHKLVIKDISNFSPENAQKVVEENEIMDAVCFKDLNGTDNNHFTKLIVNGEATQITGSGSGANPRTAIGQRADGAVLFLVCDGRGSGGHLGATAADVIGIMQDYGAVNAANLDGGSSSSMYYNGQYEMTSVTLYYSTSSWRLPTAFVVTK